MIKRLQGAKFPVKYAIFVESIVWVKILQEEKRGMNELNKEN